MLISALLVFLFGACIGSFLNVVILRTHSGKTLGGHSECPHCHHQLHSMDLIPIVSYLALAGKCRYCGHKLSSQYPAVEALTALSFAGYYFFWAQAAVNSGFLGAVSLISLLFAFFVISVLLVITVSDLLWGIIPDKIVYPSIIAAFCYQIVLSLATTNFLGLAYTLLTAAGIGLFFLCLILVTRGKGMGGGDLKLSVFLGLALGFPVAIIGLLLGFLTGAIGSVMLLLLGKKGLKSSIPFGPFLALGAYLALVFGPSLWTAYLKALGF